MLITQARPDLAKKFRQAYADIRNGILRAAEIYRQCKDAGIDLYATGDYERAFLDRLDALSRNTNIIEPIARKTLLVVTPNVLDKLNSLSKRDQEKVNKAGLLVWTPYSTKYVPISQLNYKEAARAIAIDEQGRGSFRPPADQADLFQRNQRPKGEAKSEEQFGLPDELRALAARAVQERMSLDTFIKAAIDAYTTSASI